MEKRKLELRPGEGEEGLCGGEWSRQGSHTVCPKSREQLMVLAGERLGRRTNSWSSCLLSWLEEAMGALSRNTSWRAEGRGQCVVCWLRWVWVKGLGGQREVLLRTLAHWPLG